MSHHDQHNGQHNGDSQHSGHHVLPLSVYYRVWGALLVFTVITVAISYVDFGSMNLLIAMAVATFKAFLVMSFFMGLKYDKAENSVAFFSTILFLGIFVFFTYTDEFTRHPATPAMVENSGNAGASVSLDDAKKWAVASAESLAKGKNLFGQNCATCHGPAGLGDGPAAAALNPKPRNFTAADGWKNGRKVTQIFKTLTLGIPGSPMPAFAGIAAEDRFALAHYVQSLGPKADADSDSDLAAVASASQQSKPELPLAEALARYASEKGKSEGADVSYRYQSGDAPRQQYCQLPAPWRPRWCRVNTTVPMAQD